ncbi:hypothetical protein IMZ48_40555 [Candidatus Bathyarchaeota archaeon]|nr:hypothetical protein [Candidatus Bathyarchaeota archaeon]
MLVELKPIHDGPKTRRKKERKKAHATRLGVPKTPEDCCSKKIKKPLIPASGATPDFQPKDWRGPISGSTVARVSR